MAKHTSPVEKMYLTNIEGLLGLADNCNKDCPLKGSLLAIKKSLEVLVKDFEKSNPR